MAKLIWTIATATLASTALLPSSLPGASAQSFERNESPGVAALADLSTDIVVVTPKEVHAEKSSEGSLSITHLLILRTLKGILPAAKVVPLRYGFIFNSDGSKIHSLTKPEFAVGHQYIVFLRSRSVSYVPVSSDPHSSTDFDGSTKNGEADYRMIELTDEWLSVVDEDPVLEETVKAIVNGAAVKDTKTR